jgi:hypothetical protein
MRFSVGSYATYSIGCIFVWCVVWQRAESKVESQLPTGLFPSPTAKGALAASCDIETA